MKNRQGNFKFVELNILLILDLERELMFKESLDITMPNIPPQSLQRVDIHSLLKYEEWHETSFFIRLFIQLDMGRL